MPQFRTSPSRIARYFFHHCDRQFRYGSTFKSDREDAGIPNPEFDKSSVMQGVLQQGHDWEVEVLDRFVGDAARIAPGDGAISDRQWDRVSSIDQLRNAEAGDALYQLTLRAPDRFYRRHKIDPDLVAMSDCRPDLVLVEEIGGERVFRVVDVKRGDTLKPTFQIQVLLYAMILEAVLDEHEISGRVDLDEGGVWLGGTDAPTWCDLGPLRSHLTLFLRDEMPRILKSAPEDVAWHLYFRCEWCDYFDHCSTEMKRDDDLSQLPRLTTYGKQFLQKYLDVDDLSDMAQYLADNHARDVDQELAACASLAGSRPYLEAQVEALRSDTMQTHGGRTHRFRIFTKREVRAFVTLQWEPLGDTIYMAGLHVVAHSDVPPAISSRFATNRSQIWVAPARGEVDEVRRQFVETLYDLLESVSEANAATDDYFNKLSASVVVHNRREKALLERLLLEALEDDHIADKAMELLLFCASPELLNHGRGSTELAAEPPVTVAIDAVRQVFALPVPVAYTLPESLKAMGGDDYERYDKYLFPLGHGLRSDPVHKAWQDGDDDAIETYKGAARLYLNAVRSFYDKARSHANDAGLVDQWPSPFELPSLSPVFDPILSRLVFFCMYESVSQCRSLTETRTAPIDAQILLGHVHVLEIDRDGGSSARVVSDTPNLRADGFATWLMVPDTPEGRLNARSFPDYYYRQSLGLKKKDGRALVKIDAVGHDPAGLARDLELSYKTRFPDRPERGERYLLYPRFIDWNTNKVVGFLEDLDRRPKGLFRRLLEDPAAGTEPAPLPDGVRDELEGAGIANGMTPSKIEAFDAIASQQAAAIWGPPGTGKTYFLATSIVALLQAHEAAGHPFRVLVTGFTHAAIENLLRAVEVIAGQHKVDAIVAKAGGWKMGDGEATGGRDRELEAWARGRQHYVVGATTYKMLKEELDTLQFDFVVFDESSQVRVPESAVATSFLSPDGRIVFAGDDFQLPPIVSGVYHDPETGPALHRSIFEALLLRDDDGVAQSPIVYQLTENFRQNDVLTSYARELLYPGYACASMSIADRRLELSAYPTDPIIDTLLDPSFPLVVGVIDGVQATKENEVESDLITRLVLATRELMQLGGQPVADDREFWSKGVFVVSPHRAQNAAIRRELTRRRDWDVEPFVDTVDKMQGQEAQAVFVSYGVSDPEFAMMEAEFIYSRNRLNVAISRAKSKTVVLMSRDLVRGVPGVLEFPDAAAGLAYIRAVINQLRDDGQTRWFQLDDTTSIEILRSSVPFGEAEDDWSPDT